MRAILTHNKGCKNDCPSCYHKWRGQYREYSNILYGAISHFDKFALGMNERAWSPEIRLLERLVTKKKDVVFTTVITEALKNIDKCVLDNVGLLSISYDESRIIPHVELTAIVNSINTIKVLNVINTRAISDHKLSPAISFILGEVKFDSVYLLCEKHDVNPSSNPKDGFKFTDEIIEHYIKTYHEFSNLVNIPVAVDECVYSIISNEPPNCLGKWVDISSDGSVRYCPYSGTPDFFLKDPFEDSNNDIDYSLIKKNIPNIIKCRS